MILPNGATVAVVDGEKLLVFRNKAMEPNIELVQVPHAEVDADNTGSGTRHHSSTANPDSSRLREDDFAASTAAYLNKQALGGKIEHLFLIADPRTLGEMRKHFHASLEGKIVGQLAKDLTGHPIADIEKAISAS